MFPNAMRPDQRLFMVRIGDPPDKKKRARHWLVYLLRGLALAIPIVAAALALAKAR